MVGFFLSQWLASKKISLLKENFDQTKNKLNEEIFDLVNENARFEERLASQSKQLLEKENDFLRYEERLKSTWKETNDQLKVHFEGLSQRIYEEKTQQFLTNSKENLGHILDPFKEQLSEFKSKMEQQYNEEGKERHTLKSEIGRLVSLNQSMSEETQALTNALKGDNKFAGDWGEFKLETILEASGLEKGKQYIAQGAGLGLQNNAGNQEKPDFLINLPENKKIIIDSKVSIKSLADYYLCEDEADRKSHQGLLFKSVKSHIDNLASKNYQYQERILTPEFVLLFIPTEGVLNLINDETVPHAGVTIHPYAWSKGIVIVTPSTLMATIKTIESLWKSDRQEKNARDIAIQAGKLYDKFALFIEDMNDLQRNLLKANQSYEEALKKLTTGKGNLIGQAEKLKDLGAIAKKEISLNESQVSPN